jgi:hypothetical protein
VAAQEGIMFGRSNAATRDDTTEGSHAAPTRTTDAATDPAAAQEARKDKFGGLNAGAAFFGWLVAVAVSILLTSIIGAIAAAVGSNAQLTQSQANRQAGTIGLAAAIVLLVVLMVGYYSGGYVAGRMSRFNGPRQGLGVWLIGLLITIVVGVLGAVFGQKYNLFDRVSLPRLPVSVDAITTGGVIAAVIVLAGTLLAALAGGSVGTHYHRRVDRAGYR